MADVGMSPVSGLVLNPAAEAVLNPLSSERILMHVAIPKLPEHSTLLEPVCEPVSEPVCCNGRNRVCLPAAPSTTLGVAAAAYACRLGGTFMQVLELSGRPAQSGTVGAFERVLETG